MHPGVPCPARAAPGPRFFSCVEQHHFSLHSYRCTKFLQLRAARRLAPATRKPCPAWSRRWISKLIKDCSHVHLGRAAKVQQAVLMKTRSWSWIMQASWTAHRVAPDRIYGVINGTITERGATPPAADLLKRAGSLPSALSYISLLLSSPNRSLTSIILPVILLNSVLGEQ